MPYPRNSHLKDEVIRHITASACYVEVALAAKEWNPSKLEEEIFGRSYAEQSGIFRRMAKGVIPNNTTVDRIQEVLGDNCKILMWRDNPFWKMLNLHLPTYEETKEALLSIKSGVRKYIWHDYEPPFLSNSPLYRREITQDSLSFIQIYKNVDSLFALIALSREARELSVLTTYFWGSYVLDEVFPHVIGRSPHLYISWKILANRIDKIVWDAGGTKPGKVKERLKVPDFENKIEEIKFGTIKREGIAFPPREIFERHNRIME